MAVVKQIIQALGGNCGVESTLGEGSNFWIELPLLTGDQDINEAMDLKSLPPKSKNKSGVILYIEDNGSNFELV